MNKKIGFIGAGNMGSAIIGGIINSKKVVPDNIFAYDKNKTVIDELHKKYGIKNDTTIKEASEVDILFLCIKPNIIYNVIDEIKDFIKDTTVVVSIAAGQSIKKLETAFKKDIIRLVRVMPNTPALVGEGMSAVSLNEYIENDNNKTDVLDIIEILNCLGKSEIVPELLMDAVTGVSGSSPAYVFMFIEAMADAAVMAGMPRTQAYTFAAQSVLGAARMVLELDMHPGELKDMVCSPGGTTIEAVKKLEENGMRNAVISAVLACIEKSKNM